MGRNKTITLRGPAAWAFVMSKSGSKPKTEQDSLERIATFVHMNVQSGDMPKATLILKALVADGIEATAGYLTGERPTEV
jgi:hypothetical protein